jgi:hypothetical protein
VDDHSTSLLIWFAVTASAGIGAYVKSKGSWLACSLVVLSMLGIGFALGVIA